MHWERPSDAPLRLEETGELVVLVELLEVLELLELLEISEISSERSERDTVRYGGKFAAEPPSYDDSNVSRIVLPNLFVQKEKKKEKKCSKPKLKTDEI